MTAASLHPGSDRIVVSRPLCCGHRISLLTGSCRRRAHRLPAFVLHSAAIGAEGTVFAIHPDEMRDMGRLLIFAGAAILVAGLIVMFFGRLGVGRLPGDFVVRRGNFTLYVPLLTSLIISVVLTLLLWLFRR
jgi:hypothetical protein